jgi:hypothetical protein
LKQALTSPEDKDWMQAQALFRQLRGDPLGHEIGQLRRAVEPRDPGQGQQHQQQQEQARVRQPAQEPAEG